MKQANTERPPNAIAKPKQAAKMIQKDNFANNQLIGQIFGQTPQPVASSAIQEENVNQANASAEFSDQESG